MAQHIYSLNYKEYKKFINTLKGFEAYFMLDQDFFNGLKMRIDELEKSNEELKKENAILKETLSTFAKQTDENNEYFKNVLNDLANQFKVQIVLKNANRLGDIVKVDLDGGK